MLCMAPFDQWNGLLFWQRMSIILITFFTFFIEFLLYLIVDTIDFLKQFLEAPNQTPDGNILFIFFDCPLSSFDSLLYPHEIINKWLHVHELDPFDTLLDKYQPASSKAWSKFSTVSFLYQTQSVLRQIYHNKLSCRSQLHGILGSFYSFFVLSIMNMNIFLVLPSKAIYLALFGKSMSNGYHLFKL